jgi:formate--tetrahydrofolate ligase
MGILTLATGPEDLRARLARICVAVDEDDGFVRAGDLKAVGALALTLKEAIRPNLVQTLEGSPCLVHAGPFGHLCVGASSVLADRLALSRADYVVTEVGFGSDCGAEKMVHIKCAQSGLRPSLAVLVTTIRSLKHHSGVPDDQLERENSGAVHAGCGNLAHHIGVLRQFDLPIVVALNRFPTDSPAECQLVLDEALKEGAAAAVAVKAYEQGSDGGMDLARAVLEYAGPAPELYPCYAPDDPILDKIAAVARKVYGAGEILMSERAERMASLVRQNGLGDLPVCMAKTPLSLSHDPYCSGTPRGFSLPVSDLRPAAGAGYVTVLVGGVDTMPELPEEPVAVRLDEQ